MRDLLAAGIRLGDPSRLRRVLRRGAAGLETTVVAIGASLTADHAGADGASQDADNLGFIGTPASCRTGCVRGGWLLPVLSFLRERLRGPVRLVNSGKAGHQIGSYLECTATAIPRGADVVVIDAATIGGIDTRRTEALLRWLLRLPSAPALLFVHFFDWCAERRELGWGGARGGKPGAARLDAVEASACGSHEQLLRSWRAAERTEALLDELASFYALPVLSMRRALFHTVMTRPEADRFHLSHLTADGLHPASGAGGELYKLLAASLVNAWLYGAMHAEAVRMDEADAPLPLPPCATLHRHLPSEVVMSERCYGWAANGTAAPLRSAATLQPASHGWSFAPFDSPQGEGGGAALASGGATHDEAPRRGHREWQRRPRPGLAAFAAGSEARFTLAEPSWRGAATLSLSYLSSWRGMGAAQLACTRGCSCANLTVDAHRDAADAPGNARSQRFVSIWEVVEVPLVLRAPRCELSLQVLERTRSGGHMFKLDQISVRWRTGASNGALGCAGGGAAPEVEPRDRRPAAAVDAADKWERMRRAVSKHKRPMFT